MLDEVKELLYNWYGVLICLHLIGNFHVPVSQIDGALRCCQIFCWLIYRSCIPACPYQAHTSQDTCWHTIFQYGIPPGTHCFSLKNEIFSYLSHTFVNEKKSIQKFSLKQTSGYSLGFITLSG